MFSMLMSHVLYVSSPTWEAQGLPGFGLNGETYMFISLSQILSDQQKEQDQGQYWFSLSMEVEAGKLFCWAGKPTFAN